MTSNDYSVLKQINGFHYQVLLGVEKCYELKEGQSIYFERDGDLSIEGIEVDNNFQIEAKHYDDELNNKHENFWKTLFNWLDIDHEKYQHLILHTTQSFSSRTHFKDWNTKSVDEKYQIILSEYSKISDDKKNKDKPSKINEFIIKIAEFDEENLKSILSKFTIFSKSDNLEKLKEKLLNKPVGIPKANQQAYLEALVGFVYSQTDNISWKISYTDVTTKLEELTNRLSSSPFTFPDFKNEEADSQLIKQHSNKAYYKKIEEIDLLDKIPRAVGHLCEYINSLSKDLDNHLIYKEKSKTYKSVVQEKLEYEFDSNLLNHSNAPVLQRSKLFYKKMISDDAYHMDGYGQPPIAYKNGTIHNIMDDEEENFKWKVE